MTTYDGDPSAVSPDSGSLPGEGAREHVQAIIPSARLKSPSCIVRRYFEVYGKHYTLVLTDRRVIFARSTMALMGRRVADARGRAKAEGKGLVGQLGAQVDANWMWTKRYLEMAPDHALAESTDNFAVERSNITRVSLKTKIRDRWSGEGGYEEDLLVIRTHGKKYRIVLRSGRDQAEQALERADMI